MRWWRAYAEARNDPKIQGLTGDAFKAWFNLCCLASSRDGGEIESPLDAAMAIHTSESKAKAMVGFLAAKGLLDAVPGRYFKPHNWDARQYKSDVTDSTNAERQRRYRNGHRNGVTAVTEPLRPNDHIEQNTEPEADKKKEMRASALAADWPSDFTEQFWQAFPNKIGRKDALQRLERIGKSGKVTFAELMAALHRYANKTDDRPFCNPATWLNQERWTDEPALTFGAKNGRIQTISPLIAAADELVADAHQRLAEIRGEDGICDGEGAPPTRAIPAR